MIHTIRTSWHKLKILSQIKEQALADGNLPEEGKKLACLRPFVLGSCVANTLLIDPVGRGRYC